eukprot:1154832-Pelagomonas_calceolata.AAC.12
MQVSMFGATKMRSQNAQKCNIVQASITAEMTGNCSFPMHTGWCHRCVRSGIVAEERPAAAAVQRSALVLRRRRAGLWRSAGLFHAQACICNSHSAWETLSFSALVLESRRAGLRYSTGIIYAQTCILWRSEQVGG